jgi:hypothetical protein
MIIPLVQEFNEPVATMSIFGKKLGRSAFGPFLIFSPEQRAARANQLQ